MRRHQNHIAGFTDKATTAELIPDPHRNNILAGARFTLIHFTPGSPVALVRRFRGAEFSFLMIKYGH